MRFVVEVNRKVVKCVMPAVRLVMVFICVALSTGIGAWAFQSVADGPSKRAGKPLKVLTYNIKHGRHVPQAVREIIEVLKNERPDIMCLQEITWHRGETGRAFGQVPRIAKALGEYEWCGADRSGYSGPALFVRGRIKRSEQLQLEGEPDYAVLAEVEIDGQPLIVVSAHMHSLSGASVKGALSTESDRMRQAQHLIDRLAAETLPVVIAGDFNAMPMFPSYSLVAEKYRDAATVFSDNAHTRMTKGVPARIDFVFASMHGTFTSYRVLPIDHSDHRPVVVTLQFPMGSGDND